jgi:predicted amidohydrolase YtcJ
VRRPGVAVWLVAGVLALSGCPRRVPDGQDAVEGPVTVYLAGRIRTGDAGRPLAQALAVRDGRVLAVGTRAEVQRAAGRDASVLDLGEGTVVVPGLVDAHAHLASLGRALTVPRLRGLRTPAEVVATLTASGRDGRQGDWWVGRGWDQSEWDPEHRHFPHRSTLDAAFPDAPVFLTRVDGHAAWVNSEALRRAQVSRHTPDPPGGRILRDADGEPTGVLVDNAIGLVSQRVPEATDEQHARRVQAALRRATDVGLTGVHDAGMDLRTFRYLQNLDAGGRLHLRVYAMAAGQGEDREAWVDHGTFQGQRLTLRAVKLLMDGALGSRGAALSEPYSDDGGNTGLLLLTPEALQARAEAFMARGFQVAVHAIGDRAVSLTIDALAQAAARVEDDVGRHRIEHAQVVTPGALSRMAELGLVASMQPTHATSDMRWAGERLGPQRVKGAYAWRSVLDAGIPLAFGSDFPVEDPEPLAGIYAARTRQDRNGQPEGGWQPQERLSGAEALAAFTTGAAFASFAEERRGLLLPGMDADFTVLDVDPVEDDPRALLAGRVLLTVVAGQPAPRGPQVRPRRPAGRRRRGRAAPSSPRPRSPRRGSARGFSPPA